MSAFMTGFGNLSNPRDNDLDNKLGRAVHPVPAQQLMHTQKAAAGDVIDDSAKQQLFGVMFDTSATTTIEAAHEVSRAGRAELPSDLNQATAGYGEIPFATLLSLMNNLKGEPDWGFKEGGCFWDLGSGSGRVVFGAALAAGFATAVGVE
jgi:hypothetical protein